MLKPISVFNSQKTKIIFFVIFKFLKKNVDGFKMGKKRINRFKNR